MIFNSLQFLIFFPSVVVLYWVLPHSWRNLMLLPASYYFYMNWQPGFALLLAGASVLTGVGGLMIEKYSQRPNVARRIATASIIILLLILFTFKYLSFFADRLRELLFHIGLGMEIPRFEILLPVGISFFTFQAIGYLIDVYRGSVKAERNPVTFGLFLAFFPQLVAGPIERASSLLPQFHNRHRFNWSDLTAGLELLTLGYFMKLCVADRVSGYVDYAYYNLESVNGGTVLLATFLFCFQIFADFGGYSLIAIGAARCMGFRLTQNFRQPYLATSMRDFWRRWHTSLSRWLTDYIYIPLGGNRVHPARHYFNIFFTLLISGMWHGADFTFLAWGAYHGSLQTLQAAWHKKSRFHLPPNLITTLIKITGVFILVMAGRVFFRAASLADAATAFRKIVTEPGMPFIYDRINMLECLCMILVLMIIEARHEYLERKNPDEYCLQPAAVRSSRSLLRSALSVSFLTLLIFLFGSFADSPFIYFQF